MVFQFELVAGAYGILWPAIAAVVKWCAYVCVFPNKTPISQCVAAEEEEELGVWNCKRNSIFFSHEQISSKLYRKLNAEKIHILDILVLSSGVFLFVIIAQQDIVLFISRILKAK